MFKRLLVANRAEIAIRVFRTCREMGMETVAIHSAEDRDALHARAADGCVEVPSYLDAEAIVEAAREAGADAVHPGYGFLSESPLLARRCEAAGIAFIGPPPEVLATLGDKVKAREIAAQASVEVIPGTTGSMEELIEHAPRLGLPLMIKAVSGGGGKGMRKVDTLDGLEETLAQASGEAETAFGDGSLYLEKCIQPARHVEVQILADSRGHAVHLFERECSIQRRHQKLVEEAPSPTIDDSVRSRLYEAALEIATTAGYVGAGTVEFLLGPDDSFYFMEVNARLQVEHPVTEGITDLDLVEQQLRIAAGESLSSTQADISMRGHAIECRLYAEDPASGFSPSPGELLAVAVPGGPGIRFDAGVERGSKVSLQYDPLMAKLIAWGPDRATAVARVCRALRETVMLGVATTGGLLSEVVQSEPFIAGRTHTGFLDEHFTNWYPDDDKVRSILLGCLIAEGQTRRSAPRNAEASVADPFDTLGGWRMGGRGS